MRENTVINKTAAYLEGKGWVILEKNLGNKHGVDLKAKNLKKARYYYIEAKGDPNGKNVASLRANYFAGVIGQIVLRVESKKYSHYGVALPKSYEKMLKRVHPNVMRRLNLRFFIVGRGKDVKEIGLYNKN